ncbi:MAG: MFS transporter [Defluviitaleaceae bacterium]|nr:MFS transporter [Defluviitaleaceae bacterium]
MKNTYFVLAAAYLSFLALGFFDGAFTVAWPVIRYDMELPLDRAGLIISVNSVMYVLSGSQMGRFSHRIQLGSINLAGILTISLGLLGLSAANGVAALVLAGGVAGFGMGMMDYSLNLYMTRNFSSRYMSWLHCCWSIGATLSPVLMSQMVLFASWRHGYVALASIQIVIAAFVLISLIRGVWIMRGNEQDAGETGSDTATYLTHPRYRYLNMLIFFLYVGTEYSIGFWTTSVMLDSRGKSIDAAAAFPAVYFASIMAGRIVSGYLAKYLSNSAMIRAGLLLAVVGLLVLMFTNSVAGIALVGLGFAPVYPSLMHDTARLFSPEVLTKQVGYQIAAAAMGVALLGPVLGVVLANVSPEKLFPLSIVTAALVFALNVAICRGVSTR